MDSRLRGNEGLASGHTVVSRDVAGRGMAIGHAPGWWLSAYASPRGGRDKSCGSQRKILGGLQPAEIERKISSSVGTAYFEIHFAIKYAVPTELKTIFVITAG